MKGAVRLATCASIITLIYLLYLLKNHLQGLCDQYSAGAYLVAWMANHGAHHHSPHRGAVGDKVIVMARLEEDDTNWVQEELPEYVNSAFPSLLSASSYEIYILIASVVSSVGNALSTPSTHPMPPSRTPTRSSLPSTRATSPWPT